MLKLRVLIGLLFSSLTLTSIGFASSWSMSCISEDMANPLSLRHFIISLPGDYSRATAPSLVFPKGHGVLVTCSCHVTNYTSCRLTLKETESIENSGKTEILDRTHVHTFLWANANVNTQTVPLIISACHNYKGAADNTGHFCH